MALVKLTAATALIPLRRRRRAPRACLDHVEAAGGAGAAHVAVAAATRHLVLLLVLVLVLLLARALHAMRKQVHLDWLPLIPGQHL